MALGALDAFVCNFAALEGAVGEQAWKFILHFLRGRWAGLLVLFRYDLGIAAAAYLRRWSRRRNGSPRRRESLFCWQVGDVIGGRAFRQKNNTVRAGKGRGLGIELDLTAVKIETAARLPKR